MTHRQLTEHHLEFLSLQEAVHAHLSLQIPHCLKSYVAAQMQFLTSMHSKPVVSVFKF